MVSGGIVLYRAKHSKADVRACGQTTVPLCHYFTGGTVVSKILERERNGHSYGATERNGHIQTGSESELKQKEYR